MVERRFARRVDALGSIFEFVRDFFRSNGLPGEQTFEIDLILEELFTNMIRHAVGGHEAIAIAMGWDGTDLTLVLHDFDVEPFDVTAPPKTDLNLPLHERRPGGLGLHLVQQLSDGLRYDYADRTSKITVTKRLEI